jgi:hypothetical protein
MKEHKEQAVALNSYAVQFRYEGCAIELLASAECEAITNGLAAWGNEAFNPA